MIRTSIGEIQRVISKNTNLTNQTLMQLMTLHTDHTCVARKQAQRIKFQYFLGLVSYSTDFLLNELHPLVFGENSFVFHKNQKLPCFGSVGQ